MRTAYAGEVERHLATLTSKEVELVTAALEGDRQHLRGRDEPGDWRRLARVAFSRAVPWLGRSDARLRRDPCAGKAASRTVASKPGNARRGRLGAAC